MLWFSEVSRIRTGVRTLRESSWDRSGRNEDCLWIEPGEKRILADLKGPGCITHIWFTQRNHYRDCLLRITWDEASAPSILCPIGDFFGLGNAIVNSYQSLFFTASTDANNEFEKGCGLNCYLPMPFRRRALVELVNESTERHQQYYYIDYESWDETPADQGYLHAEFRRENPFGGWAPDMPVYEPEVNIANAGQDAWANNYVILHAKGTGHYVGCNLSVANFQGAWWGEGDDMIWVDGYKWPPDLHGTGSEDFFNHGWGMQPNAYLRNGSSLHEQTTGGYQTSYVFYPENPIAFQREIKVTIEQGHGNHLGNDVSSVAYWFAQEPAAVLPPPAARLRAPVERSNRGEWLRDPQKESTSRRVILSEEMRQMRERWQKRLGKESRG